MRLALHWQILIAISLAIIVGSILNFWLTTSPEQAQWAVSSLQFIGKMFLNALKMLIVPLIFSSIIMGIAGIGSSSSFGKLGGMTLGYYMTTSIIAILIGLSMVNLIKPGIIDGKPANEVIQLKSEESVEDIKSKVEGKGAGDVMDVFLRMVPTNIVSAAANGELLGLITFALLFGFFMTKIEEPYAESMYRFWEGLNQVMLKITNWVIKFAPIGVFGLVGAVVAVTGFKSFGTLIYFIFTVIGALALHFFVVMPLLLYFVGRVNPLRQYQAMAPALLTAFSTSSSSATLPVTLECVEHRVGVSNRTTSFVLPLGATVNMDGTALYECVVAIFIAQAYGFDLSFAQQFTIVTVALLTSIGVAGIPHASLVAISIILTTIGLPLEGLGLIWIADKILDMCRTTVNVFSDSCGATIIGRLQGEDQILQDEVKT